MELIDKSKVVAELEKRMAEGENVAKELPSSAIMGLIQAYKNILSFLDTIEVKEVDLGNSMVCKVDWYDGFLLDYTQEQQDKLLEKIGANIGDKIKVILIKE